MSQPSHAPPTPPPGSHGSWSAPDATEPPPAFAPEAKRRRSRLVIALAAVAALLLVGVAVLTALLINAHSTAADLAAAEVAEDAQQDSDVRIGEQIVADAENALAEVAAEARDAMTRADEAEAAQGQAEEATAASGADLDEFLRLLRGTNPAFSTVMDASLIELGEVSCDYLDTFGNSEQTVARIGSVSVASGMTSRQAAEVTSAAIVVLCPQHKLD